MIDAANEARRSGRPFLRTPEEEKLPSPTALDAERALARVERQEQQLRDGRRRLRTQIEDSNHDRDPVVDEPSFPAVAAALRDELQAVGWTVTVRSALHGEERIATKRVWDLTRTIAADTVGVALPEHPARGDLYKHTKTGNVYVVYTLTRHTETGEISVVYDRVEICAQSDLPHSRPLAMFTDQVKSEPRFRLLDIHMDDLVAHAMQKASEDAKAGLPCDPATGFKQYLNSL